VFDVHIEQEWHRRYTLDIINGIPVRLTPGSSLTTWPLRDQNLWCKPERTCAPEKKVIYTDLDAGCRNKYHSALNFELDKEDTTGKCEMQLQYPQESEQRSRGMEDEELRRWLLLACARPLHNKHEFTVHDCVVRQQAEWQHVSETGRQHDTMIAGVSSYEVSAERRVEVCLCDDAVPVGRTGSIYRSNCWCCPSLNFML
jgi:hypothetical protein